ncbi:hypothetical protein L218DRAFT_964282 [Marasmius fiardii PR-910]|nr:hypothetical protein L218DRAFT_964282 [Marasmius fiardii PR-910]
MEKVNSSFTIHLIKEMTEEEMKQAIELHTQAFAGDSYFNAVLGGDWSLFDIRGRALLRAAMLEGELYAAKDTKSGRFISMGIWYAPGTGVFSTEAQRALGFYDWFEKLSPETKDWHTKTLTEIKKKYVEPMFTDEEMKHRWWCSGLFTDVEYRGKGCAKAIVNEVAKRASKTNGFLSLATIPPTVIKYKAMGFEERGRYVLPTLFGDLPLCVLTRRDYDNVTGLETGG